MAAIWGFPGFAPVASQKCFCESRFRRDQNKIEIPGQDPCEIGAGGQILLLLFFSVYGHVHAMLNFFYRIFR